MVKRKTERAQLTRQRPVPNAAQAPPSWSASVALGQLPERARAPLQPEARCSARPSCPRTALSRDLLSPRLSSWVPRTLGTASTLRRLLGAPRARGGAQGPVPSRGRRAARLPAAPPPPAPRGSSGAAPSPSGTSPGRAPGEARRAGCSRPTRSCGGSFRATRASGRFPPAGGRGPASPHVHLSGPSPEAVRTALGSRGTARKTEAA